MRRENFTNIDDFFFVKENITDETLDQCISFVARHKGVERKIVENCYKKKEILSINLSKRLHDEVVDVIIKTKFNNDYKFININKSKIFYEYSESIGSSMNKFNQFNLDNIKFFPSTYTDQGLVFQQLAKGVRFLPDNFKENNPCLLNYISQVTNILSSLNNHNINVSKYLKDLKIPFKSDPLNTKIINICILKLKKFEHKNIRMALTHGDFKFEHLFILNNQLEYLIDWENVGLRSILFDLLNFFVPWFVNRSYNYIHIKKYVSKFIKERLPYLDDCIQEKYDLYFYAFMLERYNRLHDTRSIEFDLDSAYRRYNLLFKKLILE
jgi:thiamine kinase-like enzyme